MSWLPWRLEYTKQGIEFAIKKAAAEAEAREKVAAAEAARKIAEAAVAEAARKMAEAAVKTAPPDEPPTNAYASKYQAKDRATAKQLEAAYRTLENQGFRRENIHLPESGAYFSQADGRWGNNPYPSKGRDPSLPPSKRKLTDAGCVPSSVAIAHATLWGTPMTPPDVADYAVHNQYSSVNRPPKKVGGTDMRMIERWADENNMNATTTRNLDTLRDGLKDHAVAVVHVHGGIFNLDKHGNPPERSHGHAIVVNGYAKDDSGQEWFFVANPGMHGRAERYAETLKGEGVIVEKGLHQGAGMVRVKREVLEEYLKGQGAYVLSKKPGT